MKWIFVCSALLLASLTSLRAEETTAEKCARLLEEGQQLLGEAQDDPAKGPEVRPKFRAAFDVCRDESVPLDLVSRAYRLWSYQLRGAERKAVLEEGLALIGRKAGADSPPTLDLLETVASHLGEMDDTRAQSRAMFERVLMIRQKHFGEVSEEAAVGMFYLAVMDENAGSASLAEQRYREAADVARKACGTKKPCETLAMMLSATARVIRDDPGRTAEFEALHEAAMDAMHDPQAKKRKR
jgi:hypothetical protein